MKGFAMFKVMSWNVENLFKPGAAAGPASEAVYEAKLRGLAATINDQVPDALALQEVGDPAALDDLVQRQRGQTFRPARRIPFRFEANAHSLPEPKGIGDFIGGDVAAIVQIPDNYRASVLGGASRACTELQGDHGKYDAGYD